jgi:hypothetical protein
LGGFFNRYRLSYRSLSKSLFNLVAMEPFMSPTNTKKSSPPELSREQRIEAILLELRPKIEQVVRQMVERAVDVPEAEEFGAIDNEFRDAGQKLATDVRQASLASRKKRGTWVAA